MIFDCQNKLKVIEFRIIRLLDLFLKWLHIPSCQFNLPNSWFPPPIPLPPLCNHSSQAQRRHFTFFSVKLENGIKLQTKESVSICSAFLSCLTSLTCFSHSGKNVEERSITFNAVYSIWKNMPISYWCNFYFSLLNIIASPWQAAVLLLSGWLDDKGFLLANNHLLEMILENAVKT